LIVVAEFCLSLLISEKGELVLAGVLYKDTSQLAYVRAIRAALRISSLKKWKKNNRGLIEDTFT
jgi:hypothetical protein